jgi:hypothetical protein
VSGLAGRVRSLTVHANSDAFAQGAEATLHSMLSGLEAALGSTAATLSLDAPPVTPAPTPSEYAAVSGAYSLKASPCNVGRLPTRRRVSRSHGWCATPKERSVVCSVYWTRCDDMRWRCADAWAVCAQLDRSPLAVRPPRPHR